LQQVGDSRTAYEIGRHLFTARPGLEIPTAASMPNNMYLPYMLCHKLGQVNLFIGRRAQIHRRRSLHEAAVKSDIDSIASRPPPGSVDI
jgi:hypothetical protein